MKKKYKLLDIPLVRKKYWNKKRQRGKRIKFYASQGATEYKMPIRSRMNIFIPSGDLLEYNTRTDKEKIHRFWLDKKKLGPYTIADSKKQNSHIFYHLLGAAKYSLLLD